MYVVAALALLIAAPPTGSISLVAAVGCMVALAVAMHVEFDTGSGFTVPSQVAFVPLLFALPPSLVPVAVPMVWAASKLPDVVRGEVRVSRLLLVIGNSWFAIGPAAVLALSGVDAPGEATPVILIVALAAQFGGDLIASALREALVDGATLREQVREAWIYGVDAALAPLGLMTAWAVDAWAWSAVVLLPLLAVFGVFARERRARVAGLVELNSAYRGTALLLGDVVDADDSYTGEHCRDVVSLALDVGARLGLDADRLRNLEFGALLHDVGKVAIPKEIINKPGKLDAREWQVIRTHTLEGQRMLDRVGGFMSEVGRIIRSHHERWDGGGYPDGLVGDAIPLEARIIACCDTYNAMTTTRSYRQALPETAAVEELQNCAGTQFDPRVVAALLAAAQPSPRWQPAPRTQAVAFSGRTPLAPPA